jgi:hypothetical protein
MARLANRNFDLNQTDEARRIAALRNYFRNVAMRFTQVMASHFRFNPTPGISLRCGEPTFGAIADITPVARAIDPNPSSFECINAGRRFKHAAMKPKSAPQCCSESTHYADDSDYFIHTGDDEFGGFYVSRPSEGWRARRRHHRVPSILP